VSALRLKCSKCSREHTARRPTRRGVEGWVQVGCCGYTSTIYLGGDGEPRVDGYCDPVRS